MIQQEFLREEACSMDFELNLGIKKPLKRGVDSKCYSKKLRIQGFCSSNNF